jgi:hypothetical protein
VLKLAIASAASVRAVLPEAAEGSVHVWEEHGQVCSYAYAAAGEKWVHIPSLASFRFRAGQRTVVAVPLESAGRTGICEAFDRHVLPMALHALGHELLHASAVLMPEGVVALTGVSGAGKSTLAHLMTLRGHTAWADDAVMFECRPGDEVRAVPLPFRLNLRPDSAFLFGLGPDNRPARNSATGLPRRLVRVIFLTRRPDAESELSVLRLASIKAFDALLRQAHCFSPDDHERNGRTAAQFLDLTARVPVHEIVFASDFRQLDRVAARVEELVTEGD